MTYIALLRGINVGGNNIIKMTDLKACFDENGFENVRTYIQSGNVLFDTQRSSVSQLENLIEVMLKKKFGYEGMVVVMSGKGMAQIVAEAPPGFGDASDKYRYDVLFLKSTSHSKDVFDEIPVRDGVDQKYVGKKAVYFSRTIKDVSKSYLSKITTMPIYKQLTIRNWNTTTKLLTIVQVD